MAMALKRCDGCQADRPDCGWAVRLVQRTWATKPEYRFRCSKCMVEGGYTACAFADVQAPCVNYSHLSEPLQAPQTFQEI